MSENKEQKIAFIEDYIKNLSLNDEILPLDSKMAMTTNTHNERNKFFLLMHILEELYPHRCSNEKCNEELFIYDSMKRVTMRGSSFKDFVINWRDTLAKFYCKKCVNKQYLVVDNEYYLKITKEVINEEELAKRRIWELEKESDHLVLLVKELRKHLNLRYKLKRMKLRIKNERGKMKCQKKN